MDKANEALRLWQEWFETDGDPVCSDGRGDVVICFFCDRDNPVWNGHEDDCIYIRAKELVKGPLFNGLDLPE